MMSTVRVFSTRRGLEIFLREDDEVALRVLVALDEVFPGDRVAVADADALELDRRLVLRVQHPELRPVIAHRRVQLDRDVDEAERNRPLPERPGHALDRSRFSARARPRASPRSRCPDGRRARGSGGRRASRMSSSLGADLVLIRPGRRARRLPAPRRHRLLSARRPGSAAIVSASGLVSTGVRRRPRPRRREAVAASLASARGVLRLAMAVLSLTR